MIVLFHTTGTMQFAQHWITIGGHEEGGKKHAGGAHVLVDETGHIHKGPAALKGKNVNRLGKKSEKSSHAIALPNKESTIAGSEQKRPPEAGTSAARSNLDGGQTVSSLAQEHLPPKLFEEIQKGPLNKNRIANLTGLAGWRLDSRLEDWQEKGILSDNGDKTFSLGGQPKQKEPVQKVSREKAAHMIAAHLSELGYHAKAYTPDGGAARVYLRDQGGYLDLTREGKIEPHLQKQKGAVMGSLPDLEIEPSQGSSGHRPRSESPDDPLERMEWEQEQSLLRDPLERG